MSSPSAAGGRKRSRCYQNWLSGRLGGGNVEFINSRILVFDMETGAFKRGWGGKGVPLGEIPNERVAPYDTSGAPPDIKEFPVHEMISA